VQFLEHVLYPFCADIVTYNISGILKFVKMKRLGDGDSLTHGSTSSPRSEWVYAESIDSGPWLDGDLLLGRLNRDLPQG
jgi:hypothetical protein